MKKLLTIAAAAAGMAFAPAHAGLIDFADYADNGPNGEHGVANGTNLTIGGHNIQVYGSHNPYFDAGNAGLGMCQVLDIDDQCNPGSDDNVTEGENVGVDFYNDDFSAWAPTDITDLIFRDADHNLLGVPGNDGMVRIVTLLGFGPAVGDMTLLFSQFIAMAQGGHAMFSNIDGIVFYYEDTQFYVSGISQVPIPGALPLLLSGIAGLGFASRRKKKAA